jgi:hypothetical protein
MRVFVLADGDPQIALALVANVNLTAFFAIAFYGLLTGWSGAVAPFVYLCYSILRSDQPVDLHKGRLVAFSTKKRLIIASLIILAINCTILPWIVLFVIPVEILALYGITRWLDKVLFGKVDLQQDNGDIAKITHLLGALSRTIKKVLAGVAVWAAIAVAIKGPAWAPMEIVQIRNESPSSVGYVVRVDDSMVTLLYKDGGIRQIPTGDVTGRHVCPADSKIFSGKILTADQPPLLKILLNIHPSYVPEPCSEQNVRWR